MCSSSTLRSFLFYVLRLSFCRAIQTSAITTRLYHPHLPPPNSVSSLLSDFSSLHHLQPSTLSAAHILSNLADISAGQTPEFGERFCRKDDGLRKEMETRYKGLQQGSVRWNGTGGVYRRRSQSIAEGEKRDKRYFLAFNLKNVSNLFSLLPVHCLTLVFDYTKRTLLFFPIDFSLSYPSPHSSGLKTFSSRSTRILRPTVHPCSCKLLNLLSPPWVLLMRLSTRRARDRRV